MSSDPTDRPAHADGLDPFFKENRSLLEQMLDESAVPHRPFVFGGAGDRFGAGRRWAVRALGADEKLRAFADALAYLVGKGGWTRDAIYEQKGAEAFDLEGKVQTLARALVDPDRPDRPFAARADAATATGEVNYAPCAAVVRKLECDEIEYLFNQSVDYDQERSPLSKVKWEEVEDLLVGLGKGLRKPMSLCLLSSAGLRSIVLCMASRLYGPTRPGSSGSSSPSETSTT